MELKLCIDIINGVVVLTSNRTNMELKPRQKWYESEGLDTSNRTNMELKPKSVFIYTSFL